MGPLGLDPIRRWAPKAVILQLLLFFCLRSATITIFLQQILGGNNLLFSIYCKNYRYNIYLVLFFGLNTKQNFFFLVDE